MAEKKYIDLTGLTHYDEKIKAVIDSKDAATLKSAKDYADSLAGNYDAAGTAETKVHELANGQVKTNTEAIATLNGGANIDGSVAKAVADAKTDLETKISAADAKAVAAQTAADNAKNAADAVDAKVGAVPEGSTVIAEIQKVKDVAYNDTEVRGLIKTNADNITNLTGRADAVEGKVSTLVGEDAGKSARAIANEELTKQLIPEDAKESLDTLQEIAAWIQNHPDDASAMNAAIAALKTKVGDIPEGATSTTVVAYIKELVDAEKVRATGAESGLDTRVTAAEKDVDDLQAAIAPDGKVTVAIADAKKAGTDAQTVANKNKSDLAALTTTVGGHTTTLSSQGDRISALETKVGDSFVAITNEEIDGLFANKVGA